MNDELTNNHKDTVVFLLKKFCSHRSMFYLDPSDTHIWSSRYYSAPFNKLIVIMQEIPDVM